MAIPISTIQKETKTEEQVKLEKLEELKALLAENEDSVSKTMKLMGELNSLGVFDAANSMLQAKEEIAKIALGQVSREPVTNLINTMMAAGGALTKADPAFTGKLLESVLAGTEQAQSFLKEDKKVGVLDLLKAMNDPDINRAVGFGLQFLKGMGKELRD
ncbi:DUF1641 domain-containing protein [Bacillus atrophaeus]|uniref:DUF1641 domain-containing protein n=3 Tax=Bacillus atrophaeus TaxID=1452 RepID=A0ABM5LZ28_BACA1|nr:MULTISPECIES: DUF1641 domain-containing protein [Bacillus]AMR62038.1 hypothetical protein A1D11_06350 [Bacillus subtilis subsp. globigii]ADP33197.1 hypothetical protein BATR1942_11330 [Bacillus atrophaeus 1942]AIK47590.1 hypothetical protein DJ95_2151 [Bacillus atrophaeus subsp. globigii]AKL86021.1 YrhD [Bacillus atrophaeus UCMB-5137]ARW07646.1 uncharacterized protein S101359_02641 [Bacillus atrophaeus]